MRTCDGIWRRFELAALSAAVIFGGLAVPALADSPQDDKKTLRAASLLFRHSVISPKYSPPKVKTEWPMGYMQLTAIGIEHTYRSGLALRRKYVEELALVSARYKMPQVYFRSSNTDRALQSAQTLALGLYPLGTGPDPSLYDKGLKAVPAPQLAFAPVPVHSVSLRNDYLLRPWTGQAGCQKYRHYVKSLPDSKLYRAQGAKFSPFLKRIASITGINEGKKASKILTDVNEIYEPLSANIVHKKPIPPEITKKDIELLRLLSDWNYHYQFFGKEIGRLTGGSFVGEVLGNFRSYVKAPEKARKLSIYSGHQRTILGVDAALGIETARTEGPFFKGRVPPLGSHYAFELHERTKGAYSVRLKFVTDEEEKVIRLPGCDGDFCPLNRFAETVADVIPKNWRAECSMKQARGGLFGR